MDLVPKVHKKKAKSWKESTDQNVWGRAFNRIRRLEDTPKSRRLQFMKTRFNKRKCRTCGKTSHYKLKRLSWCKEHLPDSLRDRLNMSWQMTNCILPLARVIEAKGRFK